jgi:hypothetical protein
MPRSPKKSVYAGAFSFDVEAGIGQSSPTTAYRIDIRSANFLPHIYITNHPDDI